MGIEKTLKYYIQLLKCWIGIHKNIGDCEGGWIRCYDCSRNYDWDTKKWIREEPRKYIWTNYRK